MPVIEGGRAPAGAGIAKDKSRATGTAAVTRRRDLAMVAPPARLGEILPQASVCCSVRTRRLMGSGLGSTPIVSGP